MPSYDIGYESYYESFDEEDKKVVLFKFPKCPKCKIKYHGEDSPVMVPKKDKWVCIKKCGYEV